MAFHSIPEFACSVIARNFYVYVSFCEIPMFACSVDVSFLKISKFTCSVESIHGIPYFSSTDVTFHSLCLLVLLLCYSEEFLSSGVIP